MPPTELRQASVLFVRLAEFAGIALRLEPEAMHELLTRYRERVDAEIARHGGTVVSRVGDAVMAVFGVPVARGNEAERAVRAAAAIHRAMVRLRLEEIGRPLRAQIGIACGQLIASHADHRNPPTITGEPVHVAAALAGEASAADTLVSDAVYRSVYPRIEAMPAAGDHFPALSSPPWRVCTLCGQVQTTQQVPFVGRHAERRQFASACETCAEAGSGQTVLVRGEAGIGKTRLVGEFVALALVTRDVDKRRRALAEGEALLDAGSVSHNYLHFYQDAIEVALASGDWAGAERYCARLADYTRAEPLPWSELYIARGRALAA